MKEQENTEKNEENPKKQENEKKKDIFEDFSQFKNKKDEKNLFESN